MSDDVATEIERTLSAFKIISEQINLQLQPIKIFPEKTLQIMDSALEPARIAIEKIQQLNETVNKQVEITLKAIKKIQENHKVGKEIRGEIVTSIIHLDEMLEEIILKKYVKEELFDEFTTNMLNDESCSSSLKYRVVARSGLMDKHEGLKNNIQTLLEIRNIIAHSKYQPTIQTVEVLHKNQVKDIQSLKKEFDSIFLDVIQKLDDILKRI